MFHNKDEMNLAEAIDRLGDAQMPKRDDLSSVKNSSSQDWDLNSGFVNAREFAKAGWAEKADDLWKMIHALALKVELGVESRYDVSGESVDIGRFLSGEPESMITQVVTPLSTVEIILNIGARCSADAEQLFNRGIAVAAIIHALQSSGRGISLKIAELNSNDRYREGNTHDTYIQLQDFGDYINPGRLAFWAAHPAALRRCFFRYQEQQPDDVRKVMGYHTGGGYGYPCDLDNSDIPNGAVYIPFPETNMLQEHYRTPQGALRQVILEFQRAGVPIEIQTGDDQREESHSVG